MASSLVKLENVYFYYVNIAKPQEDKFDATGLKKKFSITIAIDKNTAKEFKKLKLNKTVKELTEAEFLKAYKTIPEALKNDDDEYYVINLSTKATDDQGNPTPEVYNPKTYVLVDGIPHDRTDTAVGNGSFGDIRINTYPTRASASLSTSLHSILVKDLIPYTARGDEWAEAAKSTQAAVAEEDTEVPF